MTLDGQQLLSYAALDASQALAHALDGSQALAHAAMNSSQSAAVQPLSYQPAAAVAVQVRMPATEQSPLNSISQWHKFIIIIIILIFIVITCLLS